MANGNAIKYIDTTIYAFEGKSYSEKYQNVTYTFGGSTGLGYLLKLHWAVKNSQYRIDSPKGLAFYIFLPKTLPPDTTNHLPVLPPRTDTLVYKCKILSIDHLNPGLRYSGEKFYFEGSGGRIIEPNDVIVYNAIPK